MKVDPLLILVSGEAGNNKQHESPHAFVTTAKGLHFTSCSGLLISSEGSHGGVVLMPAAVLRNWLKPSTTTWVASPCDAEPQPLSPDCAICAVGSVTALSGGAATCIPLAMVHVPAVTRTAAQLLHKLNSDCSTRNWAFAWNIGGASCAPTEQAAFLLCWAQPLSLSNPSTATATTPFLAPCPPGVLKSTIPKGFLADFAPSPASSASAEELLANKHCYHTLLLLLSSLSPTGMASAAVRSGCSCAVEGAAAGSLISVVGSPFGCLAPFHFTNATINGAVACAFTAPPVATMTATATPSYCAADGTALQNRSAPQATAAVTETAVAAAGCCSCSLGPAMYGLDAHVFPGMEGALVTWLPTWGQLQPQPPPSPLAAPECGPYHTLYHTLDEMPYVHASDSCSSGSNNRGRGGGCALVPQPLALLCTPLSRRSDGVQVPLAVAWPHVAAAVVAVLRQLLLQKQEDAAAPPTTVHADAAANSTRNGDLSQEQLQLQLVSRYDPMSPTGSPAPPSATCLACRCNPPHRVTHGGVPNSHRLQSGLFVFRPGRESLESRERTWGRPLGAHVGDICSAGTPPGSSTLQNIGTAGNSATAAMNCAINTRDDTTTASAVATSAASLPSWVCRAVVLLRCNGSWATGVMVQSAARLLITTAHLFQSPGRTNTATVSNTAIGSRAGSNPWAHLQCWARVTCSGSRLDSSAPPAFCWLRARILYLWSNHLDLALLQLDAPYGSSAEALTAVHETARADEGDSREAFVIRGASASAPWKGTNRPFCGGGDGAASSSCSVSGDDVSRCYGAGTSVWAVGHSLVGPAAEWPALVSYGCVARVLRVRSGRPTMIVATTTTHAGGSGGALLDCEGRLVGLVTSNARHAGGTTLPNLAFCIAAEEIEPIFRWAAGLASPPPVLPLQPELTPPEATGSQGLPALAALDVHDEDAVRIWRLQMPALKPPAAAGLVVATAFTAAEGRGEAQDRGSGSARSRL